MKRVLVLLFVGLLGASTMAQFTSNPVPKYHAAPPAKGQKLPPILSGGQLEDFATPLQVKAYQVAAKVPRLLYQLPCYCYCDRTAGHKSLHSCFESEHGAHCGTCMQEAFYAYQQHRKGKTVKQIRQGIMHGEFQKVDLNTAAQSQ